MAYATQVGTHIRRIFNREMAYLQALLMVDRGYREVTIRDDDDQMEAKIMQAVDDTGLPTGGWNVWTPTYERKWEISKFVGTKIMPMFHTMKTAVT